MDTLKGYPKLAQSNKLGTYGGLNALESARSNRAFTKLAVYDPGVSIDGPRAGQKYAALADEAFQLFKLVRALRLPAGPVS